MARFSIQIAFNGSARIAIRDNGDNRELCFDNLRLDISGYLDEAFLKEGNIDLQKVVEKQIEKALSKF